jgi:hypothetical protein
MPRDVENRVYSVFGGDAGAREAILRRDSLRWRVLLYVLAPIGALVVSFALSVIVLVLPDEGILTIQVVVFTGSVLGVAAIFHADQVVRALSRTLRVAWCCYSVLLWVVGLGCLISFRDALARFSIH